MKAYSKDDTLYLVPESDMVASLVEEMRDAFIAYLKEYPDISAVVLDVDGVEVIDSLGVNLTIGLYKHASSISKSFRIINARERFMKVANLFRFTSIFPIESR